MKLTFSTSSRFHRVPFYPNVHQSLVPLIDPTSSTFTFAPDGSVLLFINLLYRINQFRFTNRFKIFIYQTPDSKPLPSNHCCSYQSPDPSQCSIHSIHPTYQFIVHQSFHRRLHFRPHASNAPFIHRSIYLSICLFHLIDPSDPPPIHSIQIDSDVVKLFQLSSPTSSQSYSIESWPPNHVPPISSSHLHRSIIDPFNRSPNSYLIRASNNRS